MVMVRSGQKREEKSLEDGALWLAFKEGDKEAYSILYRKYYYILINYGFHFIPNKDLVKDCLNDLFFYLWKKKESIAIPASVKSYLFAAYKRHLLNATKASKRFLYSNSESNFEITLSIEQELIQEESKKEKFRKLQKVIDGLTRRQREVIFLRYFENMTYEEIAVIMKSDINSVYVLMSRAMEVLRNSYCLDTFYLWVLSLSHFD